MFDVSTFFVLLLTVVHANYIYEVSMHSADLGEQAVNDEKLNMLVECGFDVRSSFNNVIFVASAADVESQELHTKLSICLSNDNVKSKYLFEELPSHEYLMFKLDQKFVELVAAMQHINQVAYQHHASIAHANNQYIVVETDLVEIPNIVGSVDSKWFHLPQKSIARLPNKGRSSTPRGKKPQIHQLLKHVKYHNLHRTVSYLSSLPTRYSFSETVHNATQWLHKQYTDLGLQVIKHKFHQDFPSNIISRLASHDKKNFANRIIILGAHYDSFAKDGTRSPGADDDASGTAAVLEIARVITHAVKSGYLKLTHDIWFCAFVGEEQGLVGSRYFADMLRGIVDSGGEMPVGNYSGTNKWFWPHGTKVQFNVSAVFNADMLGYRLPGTTATLGMKDRYVTPWLVEDATLIVEQYMGDKLKVSPSSSCCSDYMSFYNAGFASIGFFENSGHASDNPNYHKGSDLPDTLDFKQMKLETEAILAVVAEYASVAY